jgi:ABC-type multidrug transport system ATPase subunit
LGVASAVALYQAPQKAYEMFDRVILLYEGREIFFGRTDEARGYFEGLGFECEFPSRIVLLGLIDLIMWQTLSDRLRQTFSPQ